MKLQEFKALPLDELLLRLNSHLLSLRSIGGRLEDKFKNDEFDFSYSALKKSEKSIGIKVDGANYQAFKLGDTPPVVDSQQKSVKQSQRIVGDDIPALTKEEILFVKSLFKGQQNPVKTQQNLWVPQMKGKKKTTGIYVYEDVWKRWAEFKKQYPMYSGTDLMALALEEFMDKYGSDS